MVALQDTDASVRSILGGSKIYLPVLLDPAGTIASSYGVCAIPTTTVLNSYGEIVPQEAGYVTAVVLERQLAEAKQR